MKTIAFILLGGSFLAFAFLLYTLVNLDRLGIGAAHPRVLVEAGLGIVFLVAGCVVFFGSR